MGCANGRDAKEILKRTKNYIGVDGAKKLLEIAINENPNGNFQLLDFRDLEFEENSYDIVIDFDSLFHFDKRDLKKMLEKIHKWLDINGFFMMYAKFGDYQKIINNQQQGKVQYLYKPRDIVMLAENKFKLISQETIDRFNKKWFTIILQKNG